MIFFLFLFTFNSPLFADEIDVLDYLVSDSLVIDEGHPVEFSFPFTLNNVFATEFVINSDNVGSRFDIKFYLDDLYLGCLQYQTNKSNELIYFIRYGENVSYSCNRIVIEKVLNPPMYIDSFILHFEGLDEPSPNVPNSPTGFEKGELIDGKITLSWEPVEDAEGYRIYRNGTLIQEMTDTVYIDTGLIEGLKYEYYVTAYNSDGESLRSNILTVFVPKPPPEDNTRYNFISSWFGEMIEKIRNGSITIFGAFLGLLALIIGTFYLIGLSKKGIKRSK